MARPRSLNPSPRALRVRAQREAKRATLHASPPATGKALAEAEAALARVVDADNPPVPGGSTLDEAVRLRAIFDARKARLAAEMEALRVGVENGQLWPVDKVTKMVDSWCDMIQGRLELVVRLLDGLDEATPSLRRAFLERAKEWLKETRRHMDRSGP